MSERAGPFLGCASICKRHMLAKMANSKIVILFIASKNLN